MNPKSRDPTGPAIKRMAFSTAISWPTAGSIVSLGPMQALEIMDTLILEGSETLDVRDKAAVAQRIKGSVSSKQYGYESVLCPLIAEACISVCPKNPVSFNVDNVRALCPDPLNPARFMPWPRFMR